MARATITKAGAEVGVGGKLVKARCYHRKEFPSRFFHDGFGAGVHKNKRGATPRGGGGGIIGSQKADGALAPSWDFLWGSLSLSRSVSGKWAGAVKAHELSMTRKQSGVPEQGCDPSRARGKDLRT